jgi:aspartyl-tRNA(Asn)/glutamyl-tRNA(Gln) amidotransferase subunit A
VKAACDRHIGKAKAMKLPHRRQFLHLAAGAAAVRTLAQSTVPIPARAQVPAKAILPKRPSRDRLEEALARIADPKGEGARACLTVYSDAARAAAEAADARARAGLSLGPLDGVIVSIKDLFDVAGEATRAGSKVLADAPPAATDAPVVHRLRAAGSVIVAKTNMPEFAFSIFGANPHYGTPGNPADRTRVPGGSSSGAAVAVADGMCEIAIGSDTGASTRMPAAFCGIVGYRPSQGRVPTEGAFPYSYTLDAIGPLAPTVADCAAADGVLAGEAFRPIEPVVLAGLRLGLPQGLLLRNLDDTVAARFAAATAALRKANARLTDEPLGLLDEMAAANRSGAITQTEAYAIHRELLAKKGQDYDPIARAVIERGRGVSAADYVALLRERARLVRAMDLRLEDVDAIVLPTAKRVAPKISEVSTLEGVLAQQALFGSNTLWVSFFSLCAISVPLPREGGLPVGLMLVARNGHDRRLFRIAAAVERLFVA